MKDPHRFLTLGTLLPVTFIVLILFVPPAIAQKSQKAIDYYNSGLRKQENGDFDGALPNLAAAYTRRAVIETLQGKKAEALRDLRKLSSLIQAYVRLSRSSSRNV
ncbi:MAG: hypothetical protein ABJC10_00475 [Acidobacteriota bacterium]